MYIYSVSTKKDVLKSSELASFAQLQFNIMNMCLFSVKLPMLVKICLAVIEILAFNKMALEVYRSQKRAFLLTVHGVN